MIDKLRTTDGLTGPNAGWMALDWCKGDINLSMQHPLVTIGVTVPVRKPVDR